MERLKEKLNQLRMENDAAQAKQEEFAAKIKTLEQENLVKEQEITSLTHKNTLLEADVEKLEKSLHDAKSMVEDGAAHGSANETLQRKVQLLEEEAETTEKQLRETNEKLRLTDVKAEHYERKVTSLEQAAESWEKKYEEMEAKYKAAKAEVDEMVSTLDTM